MVEWFSRSSFRSRTSEYPWVLQVGPRPEHKQSLLWLAPQQRHYACSAQ